MAGGIDGSANTLYYLYSGQNYWTMSPSYFQPAWDNDQVHIISAKGSISGLTVSNGASFSPVININPDKITFTGNGTMQDPYVIS